MENPSFAKKERELLRKMFTQICHDLDTELSSTKVRHNEISTLLGQLEDKAQRIFELDNVVKLSLMSEEDVIVEEEFKVVELYRDQLIRYRSDCDYKVANAPQQEDTKSISSENIPDSKRRFLLPKLDMKKFNGDVKQWLGFWGQFRKIDEDEDIDLDDKFQYLLQAMEPGSPARSLVESFPPSGTNYKHAVDRLKTRFARDEILIEVYVRELLNLVLKQACNKKSGMQLTVLYDSLETQLRALESLGVTSNKYASMLYPLVESALPDDILKVWERQRSSSTTLNNVTNGNSLSSHDHSINHLQMLLDFLRNEVESEERIRLARNSFVSEKDPKYGVRGQGIDRVSHKVTQQNQGESELFTAATILSTGQRGKKVFHCLFCDSKSHSSKDCFKARSISLSERKDILMKNNACFACLKPNHNVKHCKTFVKCIICGKKHHPILCTDLASKSENQLKKNIVSDNEQKNETVLFNKNSSGTLLQTLSVKLVGKQGVKVVRALLDSASQRSYVLTNYADSLGLDKIGYENIIQSVFGGLQSNPKVHTLYEVEIHNLHSTFTCKVNALEQEKICNYSLQFDDINIIQELKKRNIFVSDSCIDSSEISLLLGADIYGKLLTGKIEKFENNLVAIETHLGWTVLGKCENSNHIFNSLCSFDDMNIESLWSLDILGIRDPIAVKSKDVVDAETIKRFNEHIRRNVDDRYEVELPWVEDGPKLMNSNRECAEKRLFSTTKKLRSLDKFSEYNKIFESWKAAGIIEEVQKNDNSFYAHYLPHHPVFKNSSNTTKIRPVFDASAKDRDGISLNTCLERGPNLIELIPNIIMKFRVGLLGVVSDIKKAFLQISISPKDREFLKFLWWRDESCVEIIEYRHARVVFGVSSSPFLLAATIDYHLDKVPQSLKYTAEKLKKSFYVDNCVTSVNSRAELEKFIIESKCIMDMGKFDLRGWVYNHSKIFEENISEMPTRDNIVSVLGLFWNFHQDTIFCDISSLLRLDDIPITKRGLLSAAQRIFDPIGFTCPVTLLPKILLQKTWKLKISWDSELPVDIKKSFKNWLEQIHLLKLCHIPRCISEKSKFEQSEDISLHVFTDSSKLSFSACIFIRIKQRGIVRSHLLQAKSRIAPIKVVTIPRLELLGAVLGCRLLQSVKKVDCFKDVDTYFWCDSKVVLTWIKTKSNWNTFVLNRVTEIRENTDVNRWNFVPGDLNIADLPSRGCSPKELLESRWWNGPEWLHGEIESWPSMNEHFIEKEAYNEARKCVFSSQIVCNNELCSSNFRYFSQYSKNVRMIAWILRFYERTHEGRRKYESELTYEEYEAAEIRLIRIIQSESFRDKKEMINFQVFQDENELMRVRTKLVCGNEDDNFKFPILMPYKHELVDRLIMEQHKLSLHAGVQTVLGILREKYWIMKGRKMVKNVISKCVTCRKFKSKSLETPFAPLPKDRINNAAAFEVTGIDLAGPLFLKGREKAWIVVFTCALYRACHFEIVKSLSTQDFLFALRRFIARRGRISVIYSDNGSNFVGASNLFKSLNWNEILKFSTISKITWRFNPPTAAWWGGWWERVVRMVKELLRRNLGKSCVTYDELITIICDCEAIINSRPLTYVYDSPDELVPITPAVFIQDIRCSETHDLDAVDRTGIEKRYRFLQKLRDSLRHRFRSEYLANLVHIGRRNHDKLKIGTIVLVGYDNVKRISWPMGRIIEIYPGKDNISRVAKIKLASGGEIIRPFQRIYPLEISTPDEDPVTSGLRKEASEHKVDESPTVKITADKKQEVATRYGRKVNAPNRYGF